MEFHVITLFPEMFESTFRGGIIGRALEQAKITIRTHPLRPFGLGNYKQVDDTPYGGGSGMVMRVEPLAAAIETVASANPGIRKILLTPQGEVMNQSMAREFANRGAPLMLIAGRYEGIDERVRSLVDQELSIGDYVLSGGEIAAMVIIETVGRLIPGVLGNPDSLNEESFGSGSLEYPQYTRPEEFRGMRVPEVLLSGNHARIQKWREAQARERTAHRRPDLAERKS